MAIPVATAQMYREGWLLIGLSSIAGASVLGTLVIFLLIAGFIFVLYKTEQSEIAKLIAQYVIAAKNRVCPMVVIKENTIFAEEK